jgi:uncharacterized protein (TIGR03437 family)
LVITLFLNGATAQTDGESQRRELDEKSRDPHFLLLRAGAFNPLETEPVAVRVGEMRLETTNLTERSARLAARQVAATDPAYYIVQFPDRILPAQAESLRSRGYEVVGYVANNAYIVRGARSTANRLQSAQGLGEFRWVGAYGAGLKVEPSLAQTADEIANGSVAGANAEQNIAISLLAFRGADPSPVRAALITLGLDSGAVIEDRYDGRTWGVVTAPRADLPRLVTSLAEIEGIEWIEQRRPHRLRNDSGVRVVQTGFAGNDTPLYRNGLTGAGQIYGAADSGLDGDHAQFKLNGDASAQTLSFATTTMNRVNGLLPVNITNPNNKVMAYYILGAGNLIAAPANPNGGQTLDPNQRSGGGFINSVAYDDSAGAYHGTATTSVAVGRDFNADGTGAAPGLASRTSGDGVAPDARVVFQDVGHPSGQLSGANFVSQALIHQQAYASGVRAHNNSYGPDPPVNYDADASDIDDVMWRLRDYNIFYAAGNDGVGMRQVTNAAKNNIVVAATESPTNGGNVENLAGFSNHGPTLDGRIKPDIAAPGIVRAAFENSGVSSSFGNSTSRTAFDAAVNPVGPDNNRSLALTSGTSFSSPMVAGAALLARQYFTDGYYPSGARNSSNGFNPSNALIKAVILNSGRNMTGKFTASDPANGATGPLPNFGQGWGLIALNDALYFTGDRRELKVLADIWNGATAGDSTRPAPNAAITTGETQTYQINNVSTIEPLRITLVWSDPKATIGASIALVNNLDLEVVDPQGTVYRGNVNFANAFSQPANGVAFDNRNPVEAVYIQSPLFGTYTVRVIGANVPGNGQTQVIAQPGDQPIDSNRQGYALIATGNFTAGAQAVASLSASSVTGGVNADRFISRNETVTATLTVADTTVVPAAGVAVQIAVDPASAVPANLVRFNGGAAGQAATLNLGDLAAQSSRALAFQITLLDDGVNRPGQAILFNVTMSPTNGPPTTTQFTIIAGQKIITYRTRFEPDADPGGDGIIVIPESAWGLRPDNPNPAPSGGSFTGPWQLTTEQRAAGNGSTASLGDPSGLGASYGASATPRSGSGVFDDTRWWTTQKILLPGLTINQSTGRVSNPQLAADINAGIESFEVDVNADFTGDTNQGGGVGDLTYLRVRTYTNNAPVTTADDSGFNDQSFTNLLLINSTIGSTGGFRRFSGSAFADGTGAFAVDRSAPDNSDVAFRLELQLRRNSFSQTGEGVFYDNLAVRLRVADTNVYAPPANNAAESVDAASFTRGVAPGQILAAFGSGFPAGTNISESAPGIPLPTRLANVSVRVNGILAPLFFVGVNNGGFQINYQLPYETSPGVAFVEVLNNGVALTSEFLTVSGAAPGIFAITGTGKGQAAALNQDFSTNSSARPESRGRFVIVFATGEGGQFVDPATGQALTLASGAAAPASPLYATTTNPTVTVGGVAATVGFSGLAPGYVGLWQLNVQIPSNAPTGTAVPLAVSMGGRTNNLTTIAVN